MKQRIILICAVLGGIGVILGFILPYLASTLGDGFQTFLANGSADEVEKIEIWRNGVNASAPEYVAVDRDDIQAFLDALRASSIFTPNHPRYDERFDVYIGRKDGSRYELRIRTGGAARNEAVFYFLGGTRTSRKLAALFTQKGITKTQQSDADGLPVVGPRS